MKDSVLMYNLLWKSHKSCIALMQSEFFHPESGVFRRGKFDIICTVEEDRIMFEGLNLSGDIESRVIVHQDKGVLI